MGYDQKNGWYIYIYYAQLCYIILSYNIALFYIISFFMDGGEDL